MVDRGELVCQSREMCILAPLPNNRLMAYQTISSVKQINKQSSSSSHSPSATVNNGHNSVYTQIRLHQAVITEINASIRDNFDGTATRVRVKGDHHHHSNHQYIYICVSVITTLSYSLFQLWCVWGQMWFGQMWCQPQCANILAMKNDSCVCMCVCFVWNKNNSNNTNTYIMIHNWNSRRDDDSYTYRQFKIDNVPIEESFFLSLSLSLSLLFTIVTNAKCKSL